MPLRPHLEFGLIQNMSVSRVAWFACRSFTIPG